MPENVTAKHSYTLYTSKMRIVHIANKYCRGVIQNLLKEGRVAVRKLVSPHQIFVFLLPAQDYLIIAMIETYNHKMHN